MRIKTGRILGLLLLSALTSVPARAQERVQVHGFLTQGYGAASDYPIYGISTKGTTDYRTLALQGRFFLTSSDQVVAQFSHQRLGSSNFMQFEDNVSLDWLFYQKRLWGNSIRVGRLPMARGLFNELRDVGVVLPFFRASKAFYSEGVETVDGVSISRYMGLGDWGLEASAFSGPFDIRVELTTQSGLEVTQEHLDRSVGGQLVLNTPIPGVRVGGSYLAARYQDAAADNNGFKLWTVSGDASFDRYFVRSEYEIAVTEGWGRYMAKYAQAGVNPLWGLWINGQVEYQTNTIFDLPQIGDFDIPAIKDYAVGANYRFNTHLVLKSEWHTFEGYQVGIPVDPFGPPVKNKYFVLGVAAAF